MKIEVFNRITTYGTLSKGGTTLTNKDYRRLTFQHRHGEKICGVGLKANSEEVAERLYALEEMIENGTLVFLPCKVGTEFWYINKLWRMACRQEVGGIEIGEYGICVFDKFCQRYEIEHIYFTKEAAEKALRELAK